jgi:hypothetical protein
MQCGSPEAAAMAAEAERSSGESPNVPGPAPDRCRARAAGPCFGMCISAAAHRCPRQPHAPRACSNSSEGAGACAPRSPAAARPGASFRGGASPLFLSRAAPRGRPRAAAAKTTSGLRAFYSVGFIAICGRGAPPCGPSGPPRPGHKPAGQVLGPPTAGRALAVCGLPSCASSPSTTLALPRRCD